MDLAHFGYILQFCFESLELGGFIKLFQTLLGRQAIAHNPLVQAPDRYAKPGCHFLDGEAVGLTAITLHDQRFPSTLLLWIGSSGFDSLATCGAV